MAQDIIPIELGLPQGDLITLWAPRWREDGEEWEAFLGDEEDLYGFPDAAQLAAFVRTTEQHDLIDHPAWHVVPALNAPELIPDDDHSYDLVGVPELVSEEPDAWTIAELAEIVGIVRSIADVCELDEVHEVLDAYEGFSLLEQGKLPFTGREGERLWTDLSEAVSEKWDIVLDAIDALITVPRVDTALLEQTAEELATFLEESAEAEVNAERDEYLDPVDDADAADETDASEDEPLGFWGEVGIDPIKIITSGNEYYTLRCYFDDKPIFLGADGEIDVFTSPRALIRQLADGKELSETDLAGMSTWDEVLAKAAVGGLEIDVDADNTYVLTGIDEDIAKGLDAIDPTQLELAAELLSDAAEWARDDNVTDTLAPSAALGWLVSFVVHPDPTRLAPSPPFDVEQSTWRKIVASFEDRLNVG